MSDSNKLPPEETVFRRLYEKQLKETEELQKKVNELLATSSKSESITPLYDEKVFAELWKEIREYNDNLKKRIEETLISNPFSNEDAHIVVGELHDVFVNKLKFRFDEPKTNKKITNPNRMAHPVVNYLATYFYGQFAVVYRTNIFEKTTWKEKLGFFTYLTHNQLKGPQPLSKFWNAKVFEGSWDKIAQSICTSEKVPLENRVLSPHQDQGILYLGITTNPENNQDFYYIGETSERWEDRHIHTFALDKNVSHSKHTAVAFMGFNDFISYSKDKGTGNWVAKTNQLQRCDVAYAKNGFGNTRFYLLWKMSNNETPTRRTCEAYFMDYFKAIENETPEKKRTPTVQELSVYDRRYTRDRDWKKTNITYHCLNDRPEYVADGEEYEKLCSIFGTYPRTSDAKKDAVITGTNSSLSTPIKKKTVVVKKKKSDEEKMDSVNSDDDSIADGMESDEDSSLVKRVSKIAQLDILKMMQKK